MSASSGGRRQIERRKVVRGLMSESALPATGLPSHPQGVSILSN
jgi:hypothetical protein